MSYVPDERLTWIVMDVSALAGAFAARLGAITKDEPLLDEAGRLVRYVVSKQTDEGAWFYADPPSASHISHDNYHTGFILDAIADLRTGCRVGRVRRRLSSAASSSTPSACSSPTARRGS